MSINDWPPGLLSRRWFPIDQGRMVVHEEWNIDVPGCPMIRSPWHGNLGNEGPHYIRQVVMTADEFERSGLANGQSAGEDK